MAASPVRKLLNSSKKTIMAANVVNEVSKSKKTPFTMKDLMVLNERTILVAIDDDIKKYDFRTFFFQFVSKSLLVSLGARKMDEAKAWGLISIHR